MKLHLINGFLGAGKTTAIIAATRYYIQQGQRVGIVTNDKGHHLVDTAFFRGEKIPTAELPGGCFRCNFDQFKQRIASLSASAAPDVIFAESVGSCVDLVNTVFSPLQSVDGLDLDLITYTVIADIRLFTRWIHDQPLPFSEVVLYTFAKQIDEAAIIVLNKIDLLDFREVQNTLRSAQERFPEKTFLLQNSLHQDGFTDWIRYLDQVPSTAAAPGFRVDYQRYSQGEEEMAWLDRTFVISAQHPPIVRDVTVALIRQIILAIKAKRIPVAHLKFYLADASVGTKFSFTALDILHDDAVTAFEKGIPADVLSSLRLLMNARVESDAAAFSTLVDNALVQIRRRFEADIQVIEGASYNPQVLPSPFSPE